MKFIGDAFRKLMSAICGRCGSSGHLEWDCHLPPDRDEFPDPEIKARLG